MKSKYINATMNASLFKLSEILAGGQLYIKEQLSMKHPALSLPH